MKPEDIKAFENALRRVKPYAGGLVKDDGKVRKLGQLWTTTARPAFPDDLPDDCATDEPAALILLATNTRDLGGHAVHLAAPILLEAEYAGPEDVILPRSTLGYRPAVALGSCLSVLDDSLETCKGRLDDATIESMLSFRKFVRGYSDSCPEVVTGPEYIDEQDVRFEFHAFLPSRLAYLQDPVVAWAETCGVIIPPEVETETVSDPQPKLTPIQWIHEWIRHVMDTALPEPMPALSLAAADEKAEEVRKSIYRVRGQDLQIVVRGRRGRESCSFMVLDLEGNPSRSLDGGSVATTVEAHAETIIESQALLQAASLKDGFFVNGPDGTCLELDEVQ